MPTSRPDPVRPLADLHLRLVSRCNCRCLHCYASSWLDRPDQLQTSEAVDAIGQALELGLVKVSLTGGEPTLHPGFSELVRCCADRDVKVKVETNGLMLGKGSLIAKLLVEHREIVHLDVAYDLHRQRGITAERHDGVSQAVLELRDQGVDVRLQTTLTEVNIDDLEELIELARRHGVRQRMFLGHSLQGAGKELVPFTLERVLRLHRELTSLGLPLEIELPPLISGTPQKGCGWALDRCEILPNGDVTACGPAAFNAEGFVAGNIRSEPLAQIWRSSPHFRELRALERSDFRGVCGICRFFEECRGSCRSLSWSRGEDWRSPYPLCDLYARQFPDEVAEHLITE